MAVTAKLYGKVLEHLANKRIDFDTDTVKVMLCTSSYAPNQDTHDYKDDVTNEVSGTGYTAGGQTLASKTVTYNATTNTMTWDAADPSWNPATITARFAVFYVDTGTASTSPLIGYWDFGENFSSSGTEFRLTLPTTGLATFAVA